MIITCPKCSARYKVKDGLIQERGKKVKCKKCSTVFIAYPDKPSVLAAARNPATAKPAPKAETQPKPEQGQDPEAAQATVKVDRTKLDHYLRQTGLPEEKSGGEETKQSTVKMDPEQFQKFMEQQRREAEARGGEGQSQATVQVDRSQIDAFLKHQTGPQGEGESSATVKVERSDLDAFLADNQPVSTPKEEPEEPQQTVQMETPPFPDPEETPPPAESEEAPWGDIPDLKTVPASEAAPQFETDDSGLPSMPDFSNLDQDLSDLGFSSYTPASAIPHLQPDEEAKDADVSMDEPSFDQAEAPSAESSEPAPPDFDVENGNADGQGQSPADIAFEDETVAAPPELEQESWQAPLGESPASDVSPDPGLDDGAYYVARVDGEVYPDLTLASLERWIKEGRLLETDEIAPVGSEDYRRADAYPEIAEIFIKYYGGPEDAASESPKKKKGLFGWFGSMFKKS